MVMPHPPGVNLFVGVLALVEQAREGDEVVVADDRAKPAVVGSKAHGSA
jgi:hypothetical protein